ncbi:MAG: hypothetical protein ACI3ZI_02075 [Candidatus Cryptobacteroides sp.]
MRGSIIKFSGLCALLCCLVKDGRRFSPLRTLGTTAVAAGLVYAIVALCL